MFVYRGSKNEIRAKFLINFLVNLVNSQYVLSLLLLFILGFVV